MEFKRCDGMDKDFIRNCELLDMDLDRRVGGKIKRDKFTRFNKIDNITEAIMVYVDGLLVGGGSIRKYNDKTTELKRIFVRPEYQGNGIGKTLVNELLKWALELGYEEVILETGELLAESCAVYKKCGFNIIPNYGPYVDIPESLCMGKKLKTETYPHNYIRF